MEQHGLRFKKYNQ